ncbi:MAG: aminoglycoside phosphotransferase family protein, partial [Chitinophagaceae bacterium]|nr:aminoglycoside phosphotransferase family protein [Chitinophagaceae bacterium]
IDLDTVMPGKFFSDIGDMIRTMSCSVDENSTDWKSIFVNDEMYKSITSTYGKVTHRYFTSAEKEHLHYSGLILTYMQSLRFLTDYLNGDVYYKINYPEHNLNRAKNQLMLLEKLEEYLKQEHNFIPDIHN